MTLLCKPDECTLLIVDTQVRLMPAIHDGETVVRRCVQLATAARELGIHVIGTEENPDGLGPLVPEIAALCDTTLAKFHFSAPAEEGFLRRLPAGRDTLVVAGCEAHVCVLQTVIGLLEAGHAVKWVGDAAQRMSCESRLNFGCSLVPSHSKTTISVAARRSCGWREPTASPTHFTA